MRWEVGWHGCNFLCVHYPVSDRAQLLLLLLLFFCVRCRERKYSPGGAIFNKFLDDNRCENGKNNQPLHARNDFHTKTMVDDILCNFVSLPLFPLEPGRNGIRNEERPWLTSSHELTVRLIHTENALWLNPNPCPARLSFDIIIFFKG